MRKIKFRGKPCYDGGKTSPWVYGTFQYIAQRRIKPGATDNGTFEPRSDKGHIVDLYGSETEVLCDTVGQFTGLYDENGREIYEGDIVGFGKGRYVCEFVEGGFQFKDLVDGRFTLNAIANKSKVIGNIHDNPEYDG